MKVKFHALLVAATVGLYAVCSTQTASALTLVPADIFTGDTEYIDTGILLEPISSAPTPEFGSDGSGCCLGVVGGGNDASINNPDGVAGGGDDEGLRFTFSGGYALTELDIIFTRGDILLSGFTANPLASLSDQSTGDPVSGPTFFTTWDGANNTLLISHQWRGGAVTEITFANAGASTDQVIDLEFVDPDQLAPALSIFEVEWDIATPIIAGDVDGDGDVDLVETDGDMMSDFDIIRDNWFNATSLRTEGDLNADGIVDFSDFGEWKDAFPFPIVGSITAGFRVVPEPSSVLLMGLAMVGVGIRKRRHG